jgi:hypothetical protein
MTEVQSWLITTGVFTLIFFVGLYFKKQEKQDGRVKKVEEALDGTGYVPPPRQERRIRDRRQASASAPANAVSQRR